MPYLIPVLTVSCIHTVAPDTAAETTVEVTPADTVVTRLDIVNGADWCGIGKINVLVYEADGLRSLEQHTEADGNVETLDIRSTAGKKECVIIANSTKDLGLKIMDRFDTMQNLVFSYEDENADMPVMVARETFTAGEDLEVTLEPFMCRIIVEEVSNAMDGWVLMEEPEVYLSEINPEVGILQEKDFRPSATREEGPSAKLPCDIGFFSQYPEAVLHCYPNDTPERVLGGCRSMLGFRCKVEGCEYEKTVAVPPMGRNGCAMVKINMDNDRQITIRISTSP